MLPGLIETGIGIYQGIEGSEQGKTKRPKYEIPKEVEAALNNAKTVAAQTKLPGQEITEDKMRAGGAESIRAMQDMGTSGMGAIADISRGINREQANLDIAAAQNWQANQRALMNQQNIMGGWQDKQQQWDVRDPYLDAMAASSSMTEGSMQNITTGVGDMLLGYIMDAAYDEKDDEKDDKKDDEKDDEAGGGTTGGSLLDYIYLYGGNF